MKGGRVGKGWEGLGRVGKGWEGLGRVGKGWEGLGRVEQGDGSGPGMAWDGLHLFLQQLQNQQPNSYTR